MSTTDTRAAFEAAMTDLYPGATFGRFASGRYNIDWVESQWRGWQLALRHAATEAAKAEQTEFKGWYCAHCQRGVDASEVTFHEQHTECGRVITDDCPPAAKATGTAGKLQPLPEPVTYMIRWPGCTSGLTESVYETALSQAMKCSPGTAVVELCTFDQMREYGQACAEAARQPAPVVAVKTWQERLDADPERRDKEQKFGLPDFLTLCLHAEIADLRAALAATNRSQP